MTNEDAAEVAGEYSKRFGALPPSPFGVPNGRYITVLRQAMRDSKPIDPDFNWWADVPPDALA